jgi:hypothetical protein
MHGMCAPVGWTGTHVCTCGVNRHAYVHACGVNRHAYVRACGFNSRALGARLTGVKLIFFGDVNVFMVNMADLGLYYVVAGDHFARCRSLARAGLVTAEGCHGY